MHVLGEGTFMELLMFLEDIAPDPVSAKVFRLARQDEGRHVGYGLSHIGYHIERDPAIRDQLRQAAEQRTTFLQQVAGASPFVLRALAVLAGGGNHPEQVQKGLLRVDELYRSMHDKRIKELVRVGFDHAAANHISGLHGSGVRNFM